MHSQSITSLPGSVRMQREQAQAQLSYASTLGAMQLCARLREPGKWGEERGVWHSGALAHPNSRYLLARVQIHDWNTLHAPTCTELVKAGGVIALPHLEVESPSMELL